MSATKPTIAVLYQFFPPDDVVSAVLFGELCEELADRGWQVSAFPCAWSSRDESERFAPRENFRGVSVRRLWRPRLRQSSGPGRLLNAAWMIARWSLLALTLRPRPDVLLVGTDPILSVLVARAWSLLSPRTRVAHWCFDLYPEAAIADGLLPPGSLLVRLFCRLLRPAYERCSVIADLGPCMRSLLLRYPSRAERRTIVPWALEEPQAPLPTSIAERTSLFGDAELALLYSGSFGRAHSYDELLSLAELIHPRGGKLVFSVRGNREAELRQAAQERGAWVGFVSFAAPDQLQARLACADVHVVTLRPAWTGTVVPSKFFGALSAGRPVLFAGSPDSSVAQWIRRFQVGWVLNGENVQEVSKRLLEYSNSPEQIDAMRQHCFATYQREFSRGVQMHRWDNCLKDLLARDQSNG
ncbi:MAG TPA: glycosyltransferase family 4 protein [Acidobacteriaceae bacterium]|nr:glycosyltransferase family 4 protein [Acidobacteriaceae bacterium]